MADTTITLISTTYEENEYGVLIPSDTFREIFAQVDSVSRAEWYEGGRHGLNPEYKFTTFAGNYSGEEVVQYGADRYSVYRTYRPEGDLVELYVSRKKGTEGASDGGQN